MPNFSTMYFKDLVGQKDLIGESLKELVSGKIPHAKLFIGSPGYGTLALALAYSRYLLCESPGSEDACGSCSSCGQLSQLQHPDVHFVFPVVQAISKTSDGLLNVWRDAVKKSPYFSLFDWLKSIDDKERQPIIGVEESKEIIRKISLKSFQGGYKVMIMYGAEQMNTDCSNKLLKLLEEPPEKTVFILLVEQQQAILPTIQSRTQSMVFPRLHSLEIAAYLEKVHGLDQSSADNLATFSEGDLCNALNLLESGEMMETFRQDFMQLMRSSYKKNVNEMMNWADHMANLTKERQKLFVVYALHMLRQCTLMNYLGKEHVRLTQAELVFAEKFSPFITGNNIRQFSETMDEAFRNLERNASAKMLFTEMSFQVMRYIHRA